MEHAKVLLINIVSTWLDNIGSKKMSRMNDILNNVKI